jgi:MFS superfamily sulfate permease-like transporter
MVSEMRLNKGRYRETESYNFVVLYVMLSTKFDYVITTCCVCLIVWFDLEIGINPVGNSIFLTIKMKTRRLGK